MFHVVEHSLDYAYNKTYHYSKHISDYLAHCHTELHAQRNGTFELLFDMESYDNDYKYKIQKLFKKKYFKDALYHELEHFLHEYHVSNYQHLHIEEVSVIPTNLTFERRLKAFGFVIAAIGGIFIISGTVIFFYNKTETHQKHLREIADEFGFEDISEVSQITHFKLC
eukprot:265739_1